VVYVWIPSTHQIVSARDVTIVEKFVDETLDDEVKDAEYLA
jgi:hypothetical protein